MGAAVILTALGLAAAFVASLGYTLKDPANLESAFANSTYYIVFALCLVWIRQLQVTLAPQGREPLVLAPGWRGSAALALILTILVFVSVPPGFRTLSDETNLLSVSQSMYYERQSYNATMGEYYYRNLNPSNLELPFKPLLFPFLTHLVHVTVGYVPWAPFAINFLVLGVLLFGVQEAVRRRSGRVLAAAAAILVISAPPVTLFATSGGFDLLSTTLLFAALLPLARFMKTGDRRFFGLAWVTLLLFANVRLESCYVVAAILVGLAVLGYLRRGVLAENFLLLASGPLFLLPIIWQHRYTASQWPDGLDWSVGTLVANVWDLIRSHSPFNQYVPFPTLLLVLAAAGATALLARAIRDGRPFLGGDRGARDFWLIAAGSIAMSQCIPLSLTWGAPSWPSSTRYYLAFQIVIALLPIAAALKLPNLARPAAMLALAISAFVFQHPAASEMRFVNSLVIYREAQFSWETLKREAPKGTLVVAERPGQFMALGWGALNFEALRDRAESLRQSLERKLYPAIWAFQVFEYDTGKPKAGFELPAGFRSESVAETMLTPEEYMRVSRLTPAPAVPRK